MFVGFDVNSIDESILRVFLFGVNINKFSRRERERERERERSVY